MSSACVSTNVQTLHHVQRDDLRRALMNRELGVSRWIAERWHGLSTKRLSSKERKTGEITRLFNSTAGRTTLRSRGSSERLPISQTAEAMPRM